MPKVQRRRTILAKIESTYGTDSVPTGNANAILVTDLNVSPLAADIVDRNLIRNYMGSSDQLIANARVECDFSVEMAGAGTAGSAPAYGPLLRACGLAETILAAPVTGSAQAGTVNTITLAAGASAVDNIYNGLLLSITSGTGSGQSGIVVAYNGTTKVATFAAPLTTAPAAASGYSIGAGVTYKQISTSFESVTIYCNIDGTLHKLTGSRGNVEIGLSAKGIPAYKFKMVGVFNTVTDTALPTTSYSSFQTPVVANLANTSVFNFLGVSSLVLESFDFNANNSVDFRALIGAEYVQITDRKVNGAVKFEAPALATLDIFSTARGNTTGNFAIIHGTVAGNRVAISSSKIDVGMPSYEETQGVVMLNVPVTFQPTLGDDDFSIAVF